MHVKQVRQKLSNTTNTEMSDVEYEVNNYLDDDNKDNDSENESDHDKDNVSDTCESDSCYGTDSDCESADSRSEMDVSDSDQDCVSSDVLGYESDCSDYSAISLFDSALVTDGCSTEVSPFRSRIPIRKSSILLACVKSATSTQPTSFTSRIPVRKTTTTKQKVKKVKNAKDSSVTTLSRIPIRKLNAISSSSKSTTLPTLSSHRSKIPIRKTTNQKVKKVPTTMKRKVPKIVIRTTKLVEGRKKKISLNVRCNAEKPAWRY